MGRMIIKPKADEDFYVVHSSVVDAPVFWGTRADLEAKFERDARAEAERRVAEQFADADKSGTSSSWGEGGWDETEIQVREGFAFEGRPANAWAAYVQRADLRAFCESIRADSTWDPRSPLIARWDFLDEDVTR